MATIRPHHIKCSLDLGTWKSAWAYVLCQEDGTHIGKPEMLRLEGMGHEIRSIGTWLKDGRFVFGNDLLTLENEDESVKSRIISFFKLGLYNSEGTKARRECLHEHFKMFPGNKTLTDFYEEAFRALMKTFDEEILKDTKPFYTSEVIANLPRKVCVSRPQVFDPQARRVMMQAAKRAGYPFVFLASEPHNVLAHLVDSMVDRIQEHQLILGDGTTILVVDAGSGTVDLVLYICRGPLTKDSRVEAVREEAGVGCGSAEVEELVFGRILQDKGRTCEELAEQIGLEPTAFRRTALERIAEAKKEFPHKAKHDLVIGGADDTYPDCVIKLKREHFTRAFDIVIEQITNAIDKIMVGTAVPDLIEVTGGFATSSYLMEKLRNRYEPQSKVVRPNKDNEECHAVALGALYRHPNLQTCSLPSSQGYAVLRDEEFGFDEEHKDCWSINENKKQQWDVDNVFKTPGGRDVVYDRLLTLIPKGANLDLLRTAPPVWEMLINDVDYKHPRITAAFVLLDHDIPDRTRGRLASGEYINGVKPWASVEVPLSFAELKRRGCETRVEKVGTQLVRYWKLSVDVFMEVVGDQDLRIGFGFKHGQNAEKRLNRQFVSKKRRLELAEQDKQDFGDYVVYEELWNGNNSEFGGGIDGS